MYQQLHIIESTASIPSKILHSDKYHQILVVGGQYMHIKTYNGGRSPCWTSAQK